jgi:hypothetical protein
VKKRQGTICALVPPEVKAACQRLATAQGVLLGVWLKNVVIREVAAAPAEGSALDGLVRGRAPTEAVPAPPTQNGGDAEP